jgi:hypothetical protein
MIASAGSRFYDPERQPMRARSTTRQVRLALTLGALFWTALPATGAVAAKLQGYMLLGADNRGMSWWHKAVVVPPKGWVEDEAWTQRYKALVLFRNGDKSRSKPVMYVRAHSGDKDLALEKYIAVAQERWSKKVPDSVIEPLTDFERAGKQGLKVFLYKNPSQPEQAFELTAFMKDVDESHPQQTYFFQVVLASPTMQALDDAKPAFYELLGNL